MPNACLKDIRTGRVLYLRQVINRIITCLPVLATKIPVLSVLWDILNRRVFPWIQKWSALRGVWMQVTSIKRWNLEWTLLFRGQRTFIYPKVNFMEVPFMHQKWIWRLLLPFTMRMGPMPAGIVKTMGIIRYWRLRWMIITLGRYVLWVRLK